MYTCYYIYRHFYPPPFYDSKFIIDVNDDNAGWAVMNSSKKYRKQYS